MNRREFLIRCLLAGGMLAGAEKWLNLDAHCKTLAMGKAEGSASNAGKEYYRLVVLGDPHLPVREREVKSLAKRQKILQAKEDVLADIDAWEDVDEVAVLGDIAAQFGIDEEYRFAKQYFSSLKTPVSFIAGNHDYVYVDGFSPQGKLIHGDAASRESKLDTFKNNFGLSSLFYSRQAGRYRLIYLSPDSLESRYLTEMSPIQLEWLSGELERYKQSPTILFFHAPLKNTLLTYNRSVNTPNFIAQPENAIDQLLKDNPQVRLWVSGHTHTPATNESYAATEINTYAGRVVNIHNADMDREIIWTNSLFLYPDKIVVRTFNHHSKEWEEALDRTFSLEV